MPNIKSAVKRVRTTETAEARNISKRMQCVQQLNALKQLSLLMLKTK